MTIDPPRPSDRCARCGNAFGDNPPATVEDDGFVCLSCANKPGADSWEGRLEAKHGKPLHQIPGKVYILHYEIPQVVMSVSTDYAGRRPRGNEQGFLSAGPIRHYVGWTQQDKPSRRISKHGPAAAREVVYLEPGTMEDEEALKRTGTCPKCGEPLSESLAL